MLGNIILAVILIVLSLVWSGVGIFELGLWIPGVSADSGFIPTVFGIVTLICSVIMLVQNLKKYNESKNAPQAAEEVKKEESPASQDIKGKILAFVKKYAPVFFGLFGLLSLQYLGLIPMVFLIILGWMKLMNQFPWKKSILFAAVVTVVIYLIFDIWLQIPFPGLI
jgi:hypothetical protein